MIKQNVLPILFCVLLISGCASPQRTSEIAVAQLIKSTVSWNGDTLPATNIVHPEITILNITIPPHHSLPMHTHPVINAGVLLKGQLTVTTQRGQVLHLKANEPIVEVVDTWHYGKNDGNEPAQIIVFYIGQPNQPITIKKTGNKTGH